MFSSSSTTDRVGNESPATSVSVPFAGCRQSRRRGITPPEASCSPHGTVGIRSVINNGAWQCHQSNALVPLGPPEPQTISLFDPLIPVVSRGHHNVNHGTPQVVGFRWPFMAARGRSDQVMPHNPLSRSHAVLERGAVSRDRSGKSRNQRYRGWKRAELPCCSWKQGDSEGQGARLEKTMPGEPH